MEESIQKKTFLISGMSCSGCELRIEEALTGVPGVKSASASYSASRAEVEYDADKTSPEKLEEAIRRAGYGVKHDRQGTEGPGREGPNSTRQVLGILMILLALYLLIDHTVGFQFVPQVSRNMGYGLLFVTGLLTSIHCLAMCGGINLSQTIGRGGEAKAPARIREKLKPAFLYNSGRVISYTATGAIAGAAGQVVSFSGAAKGAVAIFAGIFMIVTGLNLMNAFPGLRRFGLRMPKFLSRAARGKKRAGSPFYVGLLNGLMPCGPLQAMQLYALGTGSMLGGALSMLTFGLGTVPLMFSFGAVSSFLSGKFTRNMMKFSSALVMTLGLVMIGRGMSLSGLPVWGAGFSRQAANAAVVKDGVQEVTTEFRSGKYAPITVQKGIPVRWTIRVSQNDLNGCNNPVVISRFNLQKELAPGDNVIEFTPEETGTIPYSCWMGMIRSSITVVDDISSPQAAAAALTESARGPDGAAGAAGGSCCSGSAQGGTASASGPDGTAGAAGGSCCSGPAQGGALPECCVPGSAGEEG
jgi:sulfite exporter TauE/SafE/copper chaperone CopZ